MQINKSTRRRIENKLGRKFITKEEKDKLREKVLKHSFVNTESKKA